MDTKYRTIRQVLNTRIASPVIPWRRTSRTQRESLLRLIAVAAETDIPLLDLIDAWSQDETGRQSLRLERLANLLHQGTPLPNAVEEVRGVLDDEDILAIRFGTQSGTLAASVRATLDNDRLAAAKGLHGARSLVVYLCAFIAVATAIVVFLQIKIVPSLRQIFAEYSIPTPPALNWSMAFADFVTEYWWVFAFVLLVGSLVAFSTQFGRRWRRAVIIRLFWPLRELRVADMLQKLSVTCRAGRPLGGAISTLARYHFDPTLRHKLLIVHNDMEHGAELWHSMGGVGLLTGPEVQLLETADRVGNRGWVLNQLALVKSRTNLRRLARWAALAFPATIMIAGVFVLLQALSVFDSLVTLVYSLL